MSQKVRVNAPLRNRGCEVCRTQRSLRRCAACKAVEYCSQEHQGRHWPEHKQLCGPVTTARRRLAAEEEKLRRPRPADGWEYGDVFEDGAGHFWSILETRDYMRDRYALCRTLVHANTCLGVTEALDHLKDMLRLCRGDNMGLREHIPGLMLRLGRDYDQECYDFIKWFAGNEVQGAESAGDSHPCLDKRNENPLEALNTFLVKFPDNFHLVALTLLKIRLLLDIMTIDQSAPILGSKLPKEIVDQVNEDLISPSIARQQGLMLKIKSNPTQFIDPLTAQVKMLFSYVDRENRYMWDGIMQNQSDLLELPMAYGRGSREEMQLALSYMYDAWKETPRAIEILRSLRSGT